MEEWSMGTRTIDQDSVATA